MWVEGGKVSLNTLFVSNQLLMMFVEVQMDVHKDQYVAHSVYWYVCVCPEAPIEQSQTVESVTGTRGNGVVCLLWTSGVCIDEVICCRHVSYQRGRRYDLGITFPLVNQKKKNRYQQ